MLFYNDNGDSMNMFEICLIDGILIVFPILIYLLYLSTNKKLKSKNLYYSLSLISSFYLVYRFNTNSLYTIVILNTLVVMSYIEDKYILSNVFGILIVILYSNYHYIWMLILIYIASLILYLFKHNKKNSNLIFVESFILISSFIYLAFLYKTSHIFNLNIIISYILTVNIAYKMNTLGNSILNTHMTYKELQNEKQIRLSLFKITHEIKNPIAVCKGYLDMMNTNDTIQVQKYIPIIKSEIDRLLGILQDYLLINKANMDLDIMDINMLLEETIEKINPMLEEKNINTELNLIDDEIFINGDYNRLSQVIINILKNSIEAIDNKNGIIKIDSSIKNNAYFITVEDNGCGMTRDVISKMKEPFYTTKRRGSGLGVSLIYDIVEAHHGTVDYKSEYGKGTKVTLEFPIYEN